MPKIIFVGFVLVPRITRTKRRFAAIRPTLLFRVRGFRALVPPKRRPQNGERAPLEFRRGAPEKARPPRSCSFLCGHVDAKTSPPAWGPHFGGTPSPGRAPCGPIGALCSLRGRVIPKVVFGSKENFLTAIEESLGIFLTGIEESLGT
ncbi:hypothetical protein NPIL_510431 [Nephila pilipes]|uniref:Uncharacterized protein n=1 Tax=Nephila pilipes TaxID=299642 RepID=A0A8X6QBY9_NEPPI|nr:hypothetical protein NPIL_510431 [Nephila pilipes]